MCEWLWEWLWERMSSGSDEEVCEVHSVCGGWRHRVGGEALLGVRLM